MIGINVMGNIINTPSFIGIGAQNTGSTWQHYAEESWFSDHETQCEITLNQFFEKK
jgi:hypothetical protein